MEGYWHWLCSNLPANPRLLNKLKAYYKNAEALFWTDREQLLRRFPEHKEVLERLCQSRAEWDFEKEQEMLNGKGIRFLSCEHPEFPESLKQLPDCPGGLFLKGELPKADVGSVAIVGARTCSPYGKNVAVWFGRELAAQGIQVISGMARGIDGYAHRGALQGKGKTFAVLGSSVEICYPAENREIYLRLEQEGGILSENPPGTQALPYLFPLRNRIISGLADAVLIIEAKEKSGSLITADWALEQGKEVYAVPGRLGDPLSEGCLNLIRQGAGLALSPEKLLEDLCFLPKINRNGQEKNKIALERSENIVYSCVSLQARNLEEICRQTKLPSEKVLTALTGLELKGYIKEVYKNFYTRI